MSWPQRRQAPRDRDAILAKQRAEEERQQGLDPDDAAARFIADKENGNLSPRASLAGCPLADGSPTEARRRMLRGLGMNPLTVTTRGEASDRINRAKNKRGRNP